MDPAMGPAIIAAVVSFTNAAWLYAAQSSLSDYFTIFALFCLLAKRRHDPAVEDDYGLILTKYALSLLILTIELWRYFLPLRYGNDRDAQPADEATVNLASHVIPSIPSTVAAVCNFILLTAGPLHNSFSSVLPTLALTSTCAFRVARYLVLESPLHSYYSSLSLFLLSLHFLLLAIQLFWNQLPVWRKIAPGWLGTMVMLPHLKFDSLEQLDGLYAPPMAYGSRPLFRQVIPIRGSNLVTEIDTGDFGAQILPRQFYSIILSRLVLVVFTYAVPYLVQDTVTLAGRKATVLDVCKIVGLAAIIFGGKTLSAAWYNHSQVRFVIQLRNTLVHKLSKTLFCINQKCSQKFNLVKLFGKDLEKIENLSCAFHDIWSSLLELACSFYLVKSISPDSQYMAIFAPLVLTLCEPVVEAVVSFSGGWEQAVKDRIAATDLYLDQYKELKFTGYASSFTPHLTKLHGREILAASRNSVGSSMQLGFYVVCRTAAPVVIVCAAIHNSMKPNPWTVPEYFTIAAVTTLIANSWKTMIKAIKMIINDIDGPRCFMEFRGQPTLKPTDRGDFRHPAGFEHHDLQLLQTSFLGPDSTLFRYRDLRFEAKKVTMLIGSKGCGKSSLLKALLGEVKLVSGNIVAPAGPIAYCGESSFVQNLSIKENIIFQSSFDSIWYQRVLHACSLPSEMEKLNQTDETVAGEGGSKLSIELRQLVSLARAVYANHPVMLLDETFDYFEPKMADTILTRLFGKDGLLRDRCTVLFTSSSSRDSAHANTILAFTEMRGFLEDSPSPSNLPPGLFEPKTFDRVPRHASTRQSIQLREKVFPYQDNSPESIRSDIAAEKDYTNSLMAHIDCLGMTDYGISIDVMALAVFVATWHIQYLHDKLESFDTMDDSFLWNCLIFAVMPVILVPICYIFCYITFAKNASVVWHSKLMKTLERTTVKYMIQYDSAKFKKLHEQDLTLTATSLASAYLVGAFMTIGLFMEVYFAAYSFGSFAWLVCIPGFAIVTTIGTNYATNKVEVRLFDFDARLAVVKNLIDVASGVEYIRAFGLQRLFLQQRFSLLDASQRAHYYSLLMDHSLTLSIDLFVLFVALVVTGFPLYLGLGTQTTMGISLLTVAGLSTFLKDVVDSWSRCMAALAPAYHIDHFIRDAPKAKRTSPAVIDATNTSIHWPLAGSIEFKNVTAQSFAEAGGPPILNNIDVAIPAGNTVGIIGGVASGKTAFLSAILGLVDYNGCIEIDGIDARQLDDLFVQQRIVSVSSHLLEFPGTLRQNLDPLHGTRAQNRLEDSVIVDVLKKLTLWREVVARGASLDSPMTFMGLSRGQREVLAIARAILRQKHLGAKIVMIDGVLNTVDPALDLVVNRVMGEELRGCTLIKVTHHLATLEDASQVIKIHEGRIESIFQPGSDGGH